MKFTSSVQVENFLNEKGIVFHKAYCKQPVKKQAVEYWQIKVGKSYCEVYDIVEWANVVYSRQTSRFRREGTVYPL